MTIKVFRPVTIATLMDTNEEMIFSYISSNSGSSLQEISTGTGLSLTLVEQVMQILLDQELVIGRRMVTAEDLFWTASAWMEEILNNRAAARTWAQNPSNDGKTITEMASDLSVNEEVASGLARFLMLEGNARLVHTA
jgi:hypothetical protein